MCRILPCAAGAWLIVLGFASPNGAAASGTNTATEETAVPHYGTFEAGSFRCVIGDNAELGKHAARYNGVFSILAPGLADSPFVEAYAGLNLEHYFDARPRPADNNILFEPRVAPMTFTRVSDAVAELYQPPTPHYGVESWTRFEVNAPYYVDMHFRCIPHKEVFQGGFLGVFWASYINEPDDKSIYFLGEGASLDDPRWVQFCTQVHGAESSVHRDIDTLELPFAESGSLLYANRAHLRYSEPFFYGRFRDHVLIYMFAPGPIVRFAHSPSGGGRTARGDGANPAWDFQLIVPDYRVRREYRLEMRLAYKPWVDRADVLNEVRRYLAERPSAP